MHRSPYRRVLVLSAAVAAVSLSAALARGQNVVINDVFDDNNLATNTYGTGTGWVPLYGNTATANGTESGSAFHADTRTYGNYAFQGMSSKDRFDLWNSGGATIEWTTANTVPTVNQTATNTQFPGGTTADWRWELGVVSGYRSNTDSGFDQLYSNNQGGLYVDLFYDKGSGAVTGNLRAINKNHPANNDSETAAGLETIATFSFDPSYTGVADLVTSLHMNDTGFSLHFSQNATFTIAPTVGGSVTVDGSNNLVGNYADFNDATFTTEFNNPYGGDAFIWSMGQNLRGGRGYGDLKKVYVNAAQQAQVIVDTFWNVPSGSWPADSNWTVVAPTALHTAVIDNNGTATVDQAGLTAFRIDIGSDRGLTAPTDDATGRGGTLAVHSGADLSVHDAIRVGQAHNSTGTFNIDGGLVTIVGDNPLSLGDVYIGDNGNGTMTMTGGELKIADELWLGVQAGSSGSLTMSGGTLTTHVSSGSGNLLVGFYGPNTTLGFPGANGTLNLSGSATINTNYLFSSYQAGTTSTLTISGGTVNATQAIVLGRAGTSTITHTGGQLNVTDPTGNGDFVVGDQPAGTGTYNISGTAQVTVWDQFLVGAFASSNGAVNGARGTMVQAGGTINAREMIIGRDGSGTAATTADGTGASGTLQMSSGTINLGVGAAGNLIFGQNAGSAAGATGTAQISGGTIAITGGDLILGKFGTAAGAARSSGSVTQSGTSSITVGTSAAPGGIFVGEAGLGSYTMSGGSLTQVGGSLTQATTADQRCNLFVGRDNTSGTFNQSGGTVTIANHAFLGDFDNSSGTYVISGGSLSIGGNLNIGAALASNAPSDATRTGTSGQALGAKGTFVVSGHGASAINIAGNLRANPADKTRTGTANQSTLGFELADSAGTTLIKVAQNADLDGAVISFTPTGGSVPTPGQTFNLIHAAAFGATGAGTTNDNGSSGTAITLAPANVGQYSLVILPDATGEMLQGAAGTISLPNIRASHITVPAGTVQVAPNGTASGTSKVSALAIGSANALLDLTNNSMVVDYAPGASPLATIEGYVTSAWGPSHDWNGTAGLTSSAARANGATTIAVAEASDMLGLTGSATALFAGQVVDATSVLLKYTWYGDFNFDGKVNADDYALIDRGYAKGLTGWINGDVNYDGVVNSADYLLVDTAFARQTGTLSPALLAERQAEFGSAYVAALTAAVPEPASLGVLSLAALSFTGRRRRK